MPDVPVTRRALLGSAAAAALAGCGEQRRAARAEPAPPSRAPSPSSSAPPDRTARVEAVLRRYLAPTADNPRHPGYAGAVALVVEDGRTTAHTAVGHAVRYAAGPVELPPRRRVPMRPDAVFDLASITKVYTALLVLQLADRGRVDLAAPVRRYLPEFAHPSVTVAQLLAHTGGLPVGAGSARWPGILTLPLVDRPGRAFRYSSVGLMVLGRLVEKITGRPLDRALREQLTDPLGLADTGFRPLTWLKDRERLVATDARTSRGLLRGTVHDDVANRLGGVAGHAGVFATAPDVAAIGQLLLYGGGGLLSPEIVRRALTNANRGKPAIDPDRPGRTADHGLGFELNQPWFMGRLAAPDAFGHTGFTGTSLLVVPSRKTVVVLLTNRAHPNWSWSNPDTHRVALHDALA